MRALLLASAATFAALSSAGAQTIRFHPGDVIQHTESAGRPFASLMLHNFAVVNADKDLVIKKIRLEARAKGAARDIRIIREADAARELAQLAGMQEAGVLSLYDFVFQTSRLLDEGQKLSADFSLAPSEAIILGRIPLLSDVSVDEIAVIVEATAGGKKKTVDASIPVRIHQSKNEYIFPLKGVWYVGAGANINTHHRWVVNEEFALDVVRTGANGLSRRNRKQALSDYYAYKAPVIAIADGVVARARPDRPENSAMMRKAEETAEVYMQRVQQTQAETIAKDIDLIGGNYVTIEHANGEFSHYLHLAAGSVKLKEGDAVKQGDVVGGVGQSGNSTEPHLHFQVTDGEDPLFSRGLPVSFTNIEEVMDGGRAGAIPSGWIVETD
jgi:murein DD-endopeptidase MepM/ murein hydrolase activator NlpD